MFVRFHDDPSAFARVAQPFLLRDEAENNLMLGLIGQIVDGAFNDFWLASIEDENGVVGCAIQVPPQWILLTRTPATGLSVLASELVARNPKAAGVIGPVSACEVFAETWCWETRASSRPRLSQGIFRLEQVIPPSRQASGRLRSVTPADEDQIVRWRAAFLEDTGILDPRDLHDVALQYIQARSLFVWEDRGRAVSIAASEAPTPNGIRVNFVYTPPEYRNRGYASACVAELSRKLLDGERKFCFLYADMDNSTSNAIYQAIGYRNVGESVVLEFMYT